MGMKEWSLGIIKPDAVNRSQEILSIIEKNGLKVVLQKKFRFNEEILREIYKEISEEDYFPSFINFMMSNECLVFVVEGENAIEVFNELVGATDPQKAKAGTLRNVFGTDIRRNAIHSSKDKKHFIKEFKILFPDIDLKKIFQG